jgi:hypothetical protein
MNDRARRHPTRSKQRGWAQRIGIEPARDRNEGRVRLPYAQHVEMARRLGGEALGGQAGAGAGRDQGIGIFRTVQERNVLRTGAVEGRNVDDHVIKPGARADLGPRELCNLLDREPRWGFEE